MNFWPRLRRRDWYFLGGLSLIYFVLNLVNLTKLPIFVDEALYLRWAQIAWHDASWRFISLTDGKQPLFTWFVIPFLKLIRDPLFAGRFASVVAGYFTLIGSFYAGWLIGKQRLGFLVTLLALFSPYLFFYNRFGVMEALLTAGGIWSFNFSFLLAKSRRLDIALLFGFVLGFSLLVKSSAFFFLLLSPVAYLLLVNKRSFFSHKTLNYLALIFTSWIVAGVIYNIQRLSPWMHMIGQKNSFFTVPYREILADPMRLWNNTLDIFRWHFAYSTFPVVFLFFSGIYFTARRHRRIFLVLFIWIIAQLGGTVAVARLYAPRYIVFVTPFILLFAAAALAALNSRRLRLLMTFLVLFIPGILVGKLILDPIHFPYVNVDEGYVNGWSAGNGTRQIADWAVSRIRETGQPLTIYTEGTFGILPHGLELYADGRTDGLTIRGVYPLDKIPPDQVVASVRVNPETYLVLNNTQTKTTPKGLKLIGKYEKRDPVYSMRLYRVLPPQE